jgi:hypothetical protein
MQLRNARLCLDCEEVHDAQQCPICASETFVFMTRWVPAPERRERPRRQEPPPAATSLGAGPEELQAYRSLLDPAHKPNGRGWKLARQGAMSLALVGVAGWLWKSAAAKAMADRSASANAAADNSGGASGAEKDRR